MIYCQSAIIYLDLAKFPLIAFLASIFNITYILTVFRIFDNNFSAWFSFPNNNIIIIRIVNATPSQDPGFEFAYLYMYSITFW